MTGTHNHLAVIPARGGSKRIPRKNVRFFEGKPMIAYAIEAARDSGLFGHIVVSTDDDEIAAAARAAGAEVPFTRPDDLADDMTPTVPVVAHAIATCHAQGMHFENVCCIYPGVPLLQWKMLLAALIQLDQGDAAYVFPVVAFPSPVQRALRRQADGRTQPFYPQYVNTRTQDLEPAYHDAGQFYWGRTAAWSSGLNIHQNGSTIVLPDWQSIDIDTPDDWDRAEATYRAVRAKEQP